MDKPGNDISTFNNLLKGALSQECYAEMASFICNTYYRPCSEVKDANGDRTWVPSLLCRSECETLNTVWNICMVELQKKPVEYEGFVASLQQTASQLLSTMTLLGVFGIKTMPVADKELNLFAPLACDITGGVAEDLDPKDWFRSHIFGRNPADNDPGGKKIVQSNDFPTGMAKTSLFPKSSSEYTLPDGTTHDIACTVRSFAEAEAVECPAPFLPPVKESAVSCVMPCPITAFSDGEYTLMWMFSVLPGIIGFILNTLLGATWLMGGKSTLQKTPLAMRSTVVAGTCFVIVNTFPSLILHTDLPCACETIECVGDGALCAMSRSSPYFLLVILNNLVMLLLGLFLEMTQRRKQSAFVKKYPYALPWVPPACLMIISYGVEGDDASMPNEMLNAARHSFTCTMRFDDMGIEWALLWIWFSISCLAIVVLVSYVLRQIQKTISAVKSSAKTGQKVKDDPMADSKRRLCRIALTVGVLCVIQSGTNIWTSQTLSTWTKSSNLWLKCNFEVHMFRDWNAYGFSPGQTVCQAEDVVFSRGACKAPCRYDPIQSDAVLNAGKDAAAENGINLDEGGLFDQAKGSSETQTSCAVGDEYAPCDCPCDFMVQPVAPPVFVMCLSYLSQSAIICILGMSMLSKVENVKIWKDSFGAKISTLARSSKVGSSSNSKSNLQSCANKSQVGSSTNSNSNLRSYANDSHVE